MPYDINQMFIHDTPENLEKIKEFYLTLEKPPEYIFKMNKWMQYVRDEMDKNLFPNITYNPCKKLQLYFNAFVLLAFQVPYEFIEIKEYGYIEYEHDQTTANMKCCCSHPIQCIFWMKGFYFRFLTGDTCIDKTKLIPPKELKKLKRNYIDDFRPYYDSIVDVLKKREINKQRQKNIFIIVLTRLIFAHLKKYEVSMIQYRLENKKCSDCGAKSGKFNKCLFCAKRCKCGKVITDNRWDTCYTCRYPDICIMCKKNFDGKGEYKKCYTCNKKSFSSIRLIRQ